VTDQLSLLREALVQAEAHHAGLQHLRQQLGHAAGAVPMDAADAVFQLTRKLRFEIEQLEQDQREMDAIDAELRELGINPDELDDEDEGEPGVVLPEWAQPAVLMMGGVSPLAMQMLASSSWLRREERCGVACYSTASGMAVHVRPDCRR
jgi:hypothetical protein